MSTHCMIDLETLGKGSRAAIRTIGAVKFDPSESGVIDKFHVRVGLESAMQYGIVDASTLDWWLEPEKAEANAAIMAMESVDLTVALDGFSQWLGADMPVWGNGATFDNVIMTNAYLACGLDRPWSFWHDRCYRTIKSLLPVVKLQPLGLAHTALDDAEAQALHLQKLVNELGISP